VVIRIRVIPQQLTLIDTIKGALRDLEEELVARRLLVHRHVVLILVDGHRGRLVVLRHREHRQQIRALRRLFIRACRAWSSSTASSLGFRRRRYHHSCHVHHVQFADDVVRFKVQALRVVDQHCVSCDARRHKLVVAELQRNVLLIELWQEKLINDTVARRGLLGAFLFVVAGRLIA